MTNEMRRSVGHSARRFALLAVVLAAVMGVGPAQTYDVIVRNGRVLDGSGNPFFYADVGIRGDEIVALGDLADAAAVREVDASGHYVTPGFIGLHEHVDRDILAGANRVTNYTTQGFTTLVINADGLFGGIWPLREQREAFEKIRHAPNLVPLVGHGVVRRLVMGEQPQEVMRQLPTTSSSVCGRWFARAWKTAPSA